jgi:DNA-binding NarL/FixJ family response regulator
MEFAQSGDIALQRIRDAAGVSLILILSDINMPGMTGLELLPKAKAARPDVPVIMITAYGDAETKRKTLESGAEALFTNPSISGCCAAKSTRGSNGPHSRRRDSSLVAPHMSAFGGEADMTFCDAHVCF